MHAAPKRLIHSLTVCHYERRLDAISLTHCDQLSRGDGKTQRLRAINVNIPLVKLTSGQNDLTKGRITALILQWAVPSPFKIAPSPFHGGP